MDGWGIRGKCALPNIGRKSHLIRKSDESRDENGDSSGLGRFYGSLSSRRRRRRAVARHIKSNCPGPNEGRRDARGKSRFDGRFRLPR